MRIVKDTCLIDIGSNPSFLMRAHKIYKTTEAQVHRERLRLFNEKKSWEFIQKVVLPFRQGFDVVAIPETSSRVILAPLGNVFQTY